MPKKQYKSFWLALCPGPRWGSLQYAPRPHSRLGRDTPYPIPHPFDAFGISLLSAFGALILAPVPKQLIISCAELWPRK